ncbi:MAG: gliding motility-associated-like protein [Litorivivens sp.]|jgi:gliding motility-associated-like protein
MNNYMTYILNRLSLLLLSMSLLTLATAVKAQCTHNMDLNDWTIAGPLGNGQWTISDDGTQVSQDVNGLPTFFVSPKDMMNVRVTGKLRVDSLADDNDYIGFVFGVQSPTTYGNNLTTFDCWMVDWKSDFQTSADEGFSLIDIDYTFDFDNPNSFMPFFWTHNTINGFQITNTFYEEGSGWEVNQEYDIEFLFTPTRVIFKVNNVVILDRVDCFEPGRFGFYNFSQSGSIYSDFEYEILPDFALPTEVCLNESVNLQMLDANCSTESDLSNSIISSWSWDFGDSQTSFELNPTHEYATAGQFPITLTLIDEFGCESQNSHLIQVENGPTASFEVSTGCTGEELDFVNLSNSNGTTILSTQWDIDSDGVTDYVSPEISHTYTTNGDYEASLIVTSQSCADTISEIISLSPAPTTSFLMEQIGSSRTFDFTNLTAEASSYLWDFGDPNTGLDTSTETNPSYSYTKNGEYDVVLTAYNSGGCEAVYELKALVNVEDETFIPSAFSPNGDGQNDFFRVLGYDFSSMYVLIFNQWGELIFTGSDITQGWDGTAKGAAAEMGNYTYIIDAETVDGLQFSYKGIVALIR